MQYIHIKNIEKYNPGYTDRKHIWCKIYWEIFLDEDYQSFDEIDRYRLISLIVFEVYNQKPVALTSTNLILLGWNTKKRSISLTLKMLHTFLEVRNEEMKQACRRVEESRVDKSRACFDFESLWTKYPNKDGKQAAERYFKSSVKTEGDYADIQKAIKNYNDYIVSDKIESKYIKNGSTFFNNWKDWIIPPKRKEVKHGLPPLKLLV